MSNFLITITAVLSIYHFQLLRRSNWGTSSLWRKFLARFSWRNLFPCSLRQLKRLSAFFDRSTSTRVRHCRLCKHPDHRNLFQILQLKLHGWLASTFDNFSNESIAVMLRPTMTSCYFLAYLNFSFIHSLARSLAHSLTHSLTHSFIHSFIHSLAHSLIHSFIHSFIHSLIHSFIHSFTHSFIHSFKIA